MTLEQRVTLTRPLIAFAFVAEKFEQTGDIAQGLMPLFDPIVRAHDGEQFNPEMLAKELEAFYGMRVHPWAIEDWAGRLEQAGYIEKERVSDSAFVMRLRAPDEPSDLVQEGDVRKLLDDFVIFATKLLAKHNRPIAADRLERGFLERLVRMDFLNILLKPQAPQPKKSATTLTLPQAPEPKEQVEPPKDDEFKLDFLCAEYIFEKRHSEPARFDLIVQIACGALVSEVVLNFQTPAANTDLKNLTIYLDAPLVMDLLDLSYEFSIKYTRTLFDQLKKTGARFSVFPHTLQEIESAIRAPLERFDRGELASGPTGSRLGSSAFRTYARSVLGNLQAEVRKLGIGIANTQSIHFKNAVRFFAEDEKEYLAGQIGYYENLVARQRDAESIALVIRLRQRVEVPAKYFASAKYIFLTRNRRLADRATDHLVRQGVFAPRTVPPCITDRYMAGLLWLILGGAGKELSKQQLLANCATAIRPRPDVIRRMHQFLAELDSEKAKYFDALMVNDRAAHYLMVLTLGDSALITEQNAPEIYEEVERIAAEKVEREKNVEIDELKRAHETDIRNRERALQDAQERERANIDQKERAFAEELNGMQGAAKSAQEQLAATMARLQEELEKKRALEIDLEGVRRSQNTSERTTLGICFRAGRRTATRTRGLVVVGVIAMLFLLGLANAYLPELFGATGLKKAAMVVIGILALAVFSIVQFWFVPERLFGPIVERARMRSVRRKLDELSAHHLLQRYQVDWVTGDIHEENSNLAP